MLTTWHRLFHRLRPAATLRGCVRVPGELGQRLYAAAAEPKRFVLLDGGSHRNAQNAGAGQYGPVLTDLFKLRQGRP